MPTTASFTTADGIASVNLTQPIPANAKFVATAQDADSDYFYNNVDGSHGRRVESNGLSVVEQLHMICTLRQMERSLQ